MEKQFMFTLELVGYGETDREAWGDLIARIFDNPKDVISDEMPDTVDEVEEGEN